MSDGRRLVKLTETLEDFDFSSLYYGIKNYYRRPNFLSFSLNAQHTIYNMMMLCYERSANEVSKRYALQSRALLLIHCRRYDSIKFDCGVYDVVLHAVPSTYTHFLTFKFAYLKYLHYVLFLLRNRASPGSRRRVPRL